MCYEIIGDEQEIINHYAESLRDTADSRRFSEALQRGGVCNPAPNVSMMPRKWLSLINAKRFGRGNMPRPACRYEVFLCKT